MMEEIDYMRLIAHVKFKSTSPIVFQKPISKPNFLSEIAQSSCTGSSEGVAIISIVEAKRQVGDDSTEQNSK